MTSNELGQFLLVILVTIVAFLATVAVLYALCRFLVVAPPAPLERFYVALRVVARAALGRPRAVRYGRHTPEAVRAAAQALA